MVLGAEQEVVVLELADGLSVTLPLQLARELLRPLVGEAGLRRVQETLREDGALSGDIWLKRMKQVQAKLRGGDPLELAEIVRDGARRERRLTTNGTNSKLSLSEKGLCVKARQRLSGEIGLARGLDLAEADAWIDEQLAPIGSEGKTDPSSGRSSPSQVVLLATRSPHLAVSPASRPAPVLPRGSDS